MTKPEEMEDQLIETIDEDGNVVKFELIDIIDFEDKEYGLLLPQDEKNEEEKEVVLMRLTKQGEEYIFEMIEDDSEFDRVVEFIESLEEAGEDEE